VLTTALPDPVESVVLRFDLAAYGIEARAWDFLAENGSGRVQIPDPYFHEIKERVIEETVTKEVKKRVRERVLRPWSRNSYVEDWEYKDVVEKVQVPTGKKVRKFEVVASARWLALDGGGTIAKVIDLTQTKNPILRGDWFVDKASVAPAYYELLGIRLRIIDGKIVGGVDDLYKLARVDFKITDGFKVASVTDTKIVALNQRVLVRWPTANGIYGNYYWSSFDTDRGLADEDYLDQVENIAKNRIRHEAAEIIFGNPNGTQAYAVADGDGNLLNLAVANIAIHGDRMPTKLQDKQVYAGVYSCALCHYSGMVDINDKVRSLAIDKGRIALFVQDRFASELRKNKDLERLIYAAFFESGAQELVKHDNALHTPAIKAITGLTPLQNRDNLESVLYAYGDAFITPAVAAREAGMTEAALLAALKVAPARLDDDRLSPHVTALLQTPPVPVSRTQWEGAAYASMMKYLTTLPRK
jgi:hypothetical protein